MQAILRLILNLARQCKQTSCAGNTSMLLHTIILLLAGALALTPELALSGKLDVRDKRYQTMKMAMEIFQSRGLKTIVETGTARNRLQNCGGDGCSTVVWSSFAHGTDVTVDSVDISEDAVRESRQAVGDFPNIRVHEADSVKFLREYPQLIDFLYLDS